MAFKGNPAALAACGASGMTDLGKIDPEDIRPALHLQASRLANAYALPPATARTVARLYYGEAV